MSILNWHYKKVFKDGIDCLIKKKTCGTSLGRKSLTQNPLRDGILICHKGKGYDTENPSIYLFILRFNSVYAAFSEGLFH